MLTDQASVAEIDADGCEYHQAGLQLVVALFDRLGELEQRIQALEERVPASGRQRAACPLIWRVRTGPAQR